jgi:hypothetical protein
MRAERSRVSELSAAVFLSAVALVAGGACGGGKPTVRPDEMSAAQHREEARREAQKAEEHERQYRPPPWNDAPVADGNGPIYNFAAPFYNPTEWHLQEAERLRAHAGQHRSAAKQLERFEDKECRQFPPASRAACPLLGPVTKIEEIPGGIRATFAAGTRVDAVFAHMRCHYAYAQARGFPANECPLYVRGIEIGRGADPMALEIFSSDPKVSDQIRARSLEEAVLLRERAP